MATDDDLATYYPGRYVRRRTKRGWSYIDRDTHKRVGEQVWTEERERIREAVQARRAEREEGRAPTTSVPIWINPYKRKEKEKKLLQKKKEERWEQERKRAVEERKEAKHREDERLGRKPKESPKKKREDGPGGIITPPKEGPTGGGGGGEKPPEDIDWPEDYEDIEYFDVDEVGYSTEE